MFKKIFFVDFATNFKEGVNNIFLNSFVHSVLGLKFTLIKYATRVNNITLQKKYVA